MEPLARRFFRAAEVAELDGDFPCAWYNYLLAGAHGHTSGIEARQIVEAKISADELHDRAAQLISEHTDNANAVDPDANSCVVLGLLKLKGWGTDVDLPEAVRLFNIASEKGHSVAYYNLGVVHERGMGVEKDHKRAVQWYLRAAHEGHAGAMNNLGFCVSRGLGCARNLEVATNYYDEAAQKGHVIAIQNMGIGVLHGEGAPRDVQKGLELMKKAANFGLPLAQRNLGIEYREGRYVPRDLKEALYWYMRAARQGDVDGKQALMNMRAHYGMRPDDEKEVQARIDIDLKNERISKYLNMLGDNFMWSEGDE
mmetsp:Transcript_21771/g.56528  ORF Transcript_21771/g.56528 Transcript_21771/m.56528 type:complete len:312 (-) Transcript_21771:1854-2789(-)